VVRVGRQAAEAVDVDPGRPLPALRDARDTGRPAMTYDEAVRRWVAKTYGLDYDEIGDVTFDVQYAAESRTLDPRLQLEIEVYMQDATQHLFVRSVSDFGRIISEVLELSS
jgi:hypothetical protein